MVNGLLDRSQDKRLTMITTQILISKDKYVSLGFGINRNEYRIFTANVDNTHTEV